MKTHRDSFTDWALVMLAGILTPAIVAFVFIAINKVEVAGELGILLGVFAGTMALGAYTTFTSQETTGLEATEGSIEEEGKLGLEAAAAAAITEGIEWVENMPVAPEHSTRLRVTNVHGACAHGFLPGNT